MAGPGSQTRKERSFPITALYKTGIKTKKGNRRYITKVDFHTLPSNNCIVDQPCAYDGLAQKHA